MSCIHRFDGKIAIVTGAARGIGQGIALRLAAEGASVVVNDVDRRGCRRVVRQIEQGGRKAIAVCADVSVAEDADRLIAETVAAFGGLDILVNNAGIETDAPILEMSVEDWDRVFAVNTRAVFLCSRAAARVMREGGRSGKIVNVSSLCGRMGWEGAANYCASKAAVDMLTRSLALELAPHGINVNAVAPGTVPTQIVPRLLEDRSLWDAILARTPSGRFGTPEDIAAAVAFLCSPDADWIHGELLTVDGGFSLGWRE